MSANITADVVPFGGNEQFQEAAIAWAVNNHTPPQAEITVLRLMVVGKVANVRTIDTVVRVLSVCQHKKTGRVVVVPADYNLELLRELEAEGLAAMRIPAERDQVTEAEVDAILKRAVRTKE